MSLKRHTDGRNAIGLMDGFTLLSASHITTAPDTGSRTKPLKLTQIAPHRSAEADSRKWLK